ncbi:MAG: hypothetical protein U1E65_01585 [Myxococcota bacterium]
MRRSIFLLSLGLIALPALAEDDPAPAAAPAAAPAPAASEEKPEVVQLKVWSALMASATQIDGCTTRYTNEFPDRVGTVTLTVGVAPDGRVVSAKAETDLKASDRLTLCLTSIGRGWRLPGHKGEDTAALALKVEVKKGKKFRLLKPGEKQPAAETTTEEKEPEFHYTPSWNPE